MIKNILFLVLCFILPILIIQASYNHFKQEPVSGISWDKLVQDFGEIHEGDIKETTFTVSNNRKDTLIIENVQGSCGCVIVNWSHQPIIAGAAALVKVRFNSNGKSGQQMKNVTVYTNKGFYTLSLLAKVVKK